MEGGAREGGKEGGGVGGVLWGCGRVLEECEVEEVEDGEIMESYFGLNTLIDVF